MSIWGAAVHRETSAVDELLEASALEQARLIATGRLGSEELVRLYLDRVQCRNTIGAKLGVPDYAASR